MRETVALELYSTTLIGEELELYVVKSPPLPAGWTSLLDWFYEQSGLPMIKLETLSNDSVPQPYKTLLVHSNDMTPTLEGYYHQPLELNVLNRQVYDSAYLREVTLNLKEGGRPVEYGVIKIFPDRFPPNARRLIREEKRPLGSILKSEAVGHIGWPKDFFKVQADVRLSGILGLARPRELYGRRNMLLNGSRRVLAEVIEVLAPVENAAVATV